MMKSMALIAITAPLGFLLGRLTVVLSDVARAWWQQKELKWEAEDLRKTQRLVKDFARKQLSEGDLSESPRILFEYKSAVSYKDSAVEYLEIFVNKSVDTNSLPRR